MILRELTAADGRELRRIHETPEVALWWGVLSPDFPDEDPTATRFVIEHDGAVAGLVQYFEEPDPDYRHALIDIFLDPALHGRGLGTQALSAIVALLIDDRGHHRLTIDPAANNAAAIRAYEKVGFKPIGVLHQYEHDHEGDGWHDCLLMEYLASDRA